MVTPLRRDIALLVARVALGVVFVAHGWQKLAEYGLAATAASFGQMGVPLPTVSAWFSAIVEVAGGAALVLGLAVPVAGVLLAVDMLGAFLMVHIGNGVFVTDNGFELVLALGAGAVVLAGLGGGRFSLDRVIAPRLAARRSPQTVS